MDWLCFLQLKDSSLFRHAAYVNSEWITSDKTFSVYGMSE